MKNRKTKIFIWLFIGILLVTIAIQLRISGSRSLNSFYDVGKKFIVSYEYYTSSYEGLEYGADGRYEVTSEDTSVSFLIDAQRNRDWNYLYINIKDIEKIPLKLDIAFTNVKGDIVGQTKAEIKEGMNEIPIISDRKLNAAVIGIKEQKGSRFRIESMQFRERQSFYSNGKAAAMFGIGMAVYVLVTGLVFLLLRKRISALRKIHLMESLSKLYDIAVSWQGKAAGRLHDKTAGMIRRLTFIVMIALMMWTENYGEYNQWDYYKYFLAANCILVFIIGLVSAKKKGRRVCFENPLMLSWFLYAVLACISDVAVPKTQPLTGVVMLIFFGMLYYIMSRMERPVIVLYDFMAAVQVTYVVTGIFCLICRPLSAMVEGRYIGVTVSPYSYALYLCIVIAIFLAELDRCFLERRSFTRVFFYLAGLISAMYFMWITGSRDGVLAMGFCLLVFLVRILLMSKNREYGKRVLLAGGMCVVISLPLLWVQDWAVHNLPDKWDTTVIFINDFRMTPDQPVAADDSVGELDIPQARDIVLAGEDKPTADTKIRGILRYAPSLDILSSGRITIYKEYIANMNLFGHEKDPYIWGKKMRAHNAILQTGYRYGIFTMIPYTVMMLYVLYYAWNYMKRNWNKKKMYAALPFLLAIACEVTMMLDNVERNFRYLPWITFYLLIGVLGNTYKEEKYL